MLREHVTVAGSELIFDFPAKSGQRRVQAIADRDALALVAALKRRRSGSQLLAWRKDKRWTELHADEVNEYVKHVSGGDFTAKDFRTWNATVLAAVALSDDAPEKTRAARERSVSKAIKSVAAYLGNTPAVCRASYVDPRVIDRYLAGSTIAAEIAELPAGDPNLADARIRARIEAAVLELLEDAA
jgi:DNA topoisomerase IB